MSVPSRALVLYHGNCPDGFTAAWAVWRDLGDDAEYRAVLYGEPPPLDVAGRRVVVVDFSYPRAAMDHLADEASSVEVYDHHKSAIEDLAGWIRGRTVFDLERSGASIAWDEFHQGEATWLGLRPNLVSYVEDRDLWRFKLEHSREVSAYLASLPKTFVEWERVNEQLGQSASPVTVAFMSIVEVGRGLLQAQRQRIEIICANARVLQFAPGVELPVVNTAWDFSECADYLCRKFPEVLAAGYYFDRADRRQWGFRTIGDYDVSVLCKLYGGGGHKGAAGFTSEIGWLP